MEGAGCLVLELPIKDPSFDLVKAVCSHGLFMMAPNLWDPSTKTLQRPLRLSSSSSSSSSSLTVRISHPSPSHPLLVSVLGVGSLCSQDQQLLLAQVQRMLRLSDEDEQAIREFHAVHEGARERGFGRIFRSPTLFEDMVKCILLCNCQFSRTLSMARALCELQLELKSCSTTEDFHPKTPQSKELKRKRGEEKKVAMKLEAKLVDDNEELSEDANPAIKDSQPKHAVENELFSSVLSDLDVHDTCDTSQPSNITIKDDYDDTGDFPTPEELATLDSEFLMKRCKLGYRAQRIVSLAKGIVDGKMHLKKLEQECDTSASSSYDVLDEHLAGISGFGPFTRANVLMCMGFYNRVPADSETIRHLKSFHKRSCNIESVRKHVEAIYRKYAPFQFLAYWSELWDYYEKHFGNSSEMKASDYQRITASNMKSKRQKKRSTR